MTSCKKLAIHKSKGPIYEKSWNYIELPDVLCFVEFLTYHGFVLFQDGRIDYGEFVAMMQKGTMGLGRRTMRNSLNISMRDAAGTR